LPSPWESGWEFESASASRSVFGSASTSPEEFGSESESASASRSVFGSASESALQSVSASV
jgi:hypothetical protein